MAENTEVAVAPVAPAEAKKSTKKVASGVKKPKAKPTHPPTSQMVDAAIKTLKERGGSSLLAIKKYLAANYKVDADKLAPFIKKYLKSSVENGRFIQTKGKGASGSFKLSASAAKPKKEAKPKVKKPEKKVKKAASTAKKAAGDKKKPATKKVLSEKKKSEKSVAKAAKKTASVKSKTPKQKPTKPSKTDAKKPKAPKPKKAVAAKKPVAKKPAAKK